ncbi:MAG TPA: alpha/beta fold hydrolase [Vicinamibacteria bacterium]|nr:alpha/beta fold hydrolase [Vicinamibacteria bacterium]
MSRFLIWLTTAFLFVPGGAVAESVLTGDLPRQANLEFRTRAVDGGLEVLDLADRSPAASAGVQDGDVIVAVNGRTFAKPYVGEDLLRRLDGGDRARLSIRRGSSQVEVEFRPQAEPLENLEGVTSTYAVLDVPDGSRLRTIVTRPDGAVGRLPAVFLVQWVSCGSIEIRSPGATRDVIRAMAERTGAALLRVERSATGDSEGPACHELDYDTELTHYRHAFDALTRQEGIDPQRIVIMGMSLGSTVAPLVARGKTIAGITVGGGGALTYFERMVNFDRINLERRPVPPEDIHEILVKRILFQTEYLLRKKSPEQIAVEFPELADVWAGILGAGDGVHYGRPYAYHQQAAEKNWLEAWTTIDAPVLVTFGELDQFEMRHGHELIVQTVNRIRPGSAGFVSFANMDHDYGVYASAEDAYSWTYGPSAPGHDAPELVIGTVLRWLRDTVGFSTVQLD